MTGRAYIIAQAVVDDPVAYEDYKRLAGAAVAKHGGRYIVRGGATHLLEGEWSPPRLVIIEFDSIDQARRFYASPDYQAAKEARSGAARMNVLVVEGM
jgi:uncharacterized protein (DUF1330 family)